MLARHLSAYTSSRCRVLTYSTRGSYKTMLLIIACFATLFVNIAIAAPASPAPETRDDVPSENTLPPFDLAEEPCTVGKIQYKHGEKVPRADPCELCLCLHSGLFCWWQDQPGCPQRFSAVSHSAKDTENLAPSSNSAAPSTDIPPCIRESCESGTLTAVSSPPMTASTMRAAGENATPQTLPQVSSSQEPIIDTQATLSSVASVAAVAPAVDVSITPPASTSQPHATTCTVMGTEYQVGQVLPRATGTCLECICREGSRLSCSPKDCGNSGSGSTHESSSNSGGTSTNDLDLGPSLDMFDVDAF